MYEVELKFPLRDVDDLLVRLTAGGGAFGKGIDQCDRYFNHPSRDFEQTDEAFRIRSVEGANFATYKGPVVDQQTKTRREIEVPLGDGSATAEQFAEILTALGFREVRAVRKHRIPYHLERDGRRYEITLDEVQGLGTFAEIETLVEEKDREEAKGEILALAERLGLSSPERKSYLCLLLEKEREKK